MSIFFLVIGLIDAKIVEYFQTTKYLIQKKEINFRLSLFFRTPAGGRTLDTLIKSQVLYQLSYKRILLVLRLQRY